MRWKGRASSSSSHSTFMTLTEFARPQTVSSFGMSHHRDGDMGGEARVLRLQPLIPGFQVRQGGALDRQGEPAVEVGAERYVSEGEAARDVILPGELPIDDGP